MMGDPASGFLMAVNKRETWMNARLQKVAEAKVAEEEAKAAEQEMWSYFPHLRLQEPATERPRRRDRIGQLPDTVLHNILSFLPMQMSVQTSILAKRWRDLWKNTTAVDFHDLPAGPLAAANYVFIQRCLNRLQSPELRSFSIVGHVVKDSQPDVATWVGHAISKKVQALTLGLMSLGGNHLDLPRSLFTRARTKTIEVLFLSWVVFAPPPTPKATFSGFDSLRSLSLTHSRLNDDMVESLLAKCPALQDLLLDSCPGLANVRIHGKDLKLKHLVFKWSLDSSSAMKLIEVDAPGLVSLEYSGDLTNIRLTNSEGLESIVLVAASTNSVKEIAEENMEHIRELINQITQVKVLGFDRQLLQFVEKEYYSKGTPFSAFQNVYQLTWYGSPRFEKDIYNLIAFFGNCPSLQSLIMDCREVYWDSFCQDKVSIKKPRIVLVKDAAAAVAAAAGVGAGKIEKLKTVKVKGFSGYEGEKMMVRLLLAKGANLEKVELLWPDHPTIMCDNVLQTVAMITGPTDLPDALNPRSTVLELATFDRASPNVQVYSQQEWEPCRWVSSFGL